MAIGSLQMHYEQLRSITNVSMKFLLILMDNLICLSPLEDCAILLKIPKIVGTIL